MEVTEDTLFNGRLRCRQHADGYRFSVDALLLAHFIAPAAGERVLDLGAGCGVVSLLLCYRHAALSLTALELQAPLARLLRDNVALNGLGQRITLIEGDLRRIRELCPTESFDWVVANPPYGKLAAGRCNPGGEQARARHEIDATLDDVLQAIFFALKNRGRAALIYPAARGAGLIASLKNRNLEPKRLQTVHSYPGGEARLLLVEAMKNGGEELAVLPPFFIYDYPSGPYSAAMQQLHRP